MEPGRMFTAIMVGLALGGIMGILIHSRVIDQHEKDPVKECRVCIEKIKESMDK